MKIFQEKISEKVWDLKYRYRYQNEILDQTIEDTWQRVAKTVIKAERRENRQKWQQSFYDIMADFKFLPGGRILAGAGTKHQVTMFNCFVMPIIEDSLPGIFEALKEGALTLQRGGGVGYDFSTLRPRGQIVKRTGSSASGPVSFMRIWNAMCATMLSTGARRGAMMGVLRCDHPDIEEFIQAKANPNELRNFNVSVLVTDAFMQAVKENKEWELLFPLGENDAPDKDAIYRHWSGTREPVACRIIRRVNARELWQSIIRSAYDYAEPGVLFEDTMNRLNNLWYREWITTTNPCGEIPLPPYGACNLGAINLTQFIINPYSEKADLDWKGIENTVITATRFMDNVIDTSNFPLKMQRFEALSTRRIGLGFTGLADILVMLGLRYGSEESLKMVNRVMKLIAETTWHASIDLAKEKGIFPAFQINQYLQGDFVQQFSPEIRQAVAKHGIRNSHHNTIAPTGTISLLANNVSNGLEPIFSSNYERSLRLPTGELEKYPVTDYALRIWQQTNKDKTLPPAWVDSQSLTPKDHLEIQRAVQPFIDNAISKTINIPADFPFEKLSEVYSQAYEYGLKGCTIFRPNPVTGSVLKVRVAEEVDDRCCRG